jgi:5-methylthioribose kinase
MIRRILGLAHVLDLESIKDPDRRAQCERLALRLARALMVERARFGSIQEVTQAARDVLRTVVV